MPAKPTFSTTPAKHKIRLPHQKEAEKDTDKPKHTVRHKHEPKTSDVRDCTQCENAVQVSDTEWECSAKVYYPLTKLCFKPRTTKDK
jgi:hypothetical protein